MISPHPAEREEAEYEGPITVTVTRPDTGAVLQERTFRDDYMLVCNGTRYVKGAQIWGMTHTIHIAVKKP